MVDGDCLSGADAGCCHDCTDFHSKLVWVYVPRITNVFEMSPFPLSKSLSGVVYRHGGRGKDVLQDPKKI